MISLALAEKLKEAGLIWRTSVNDFFGVPDRGLDDKVFVISDLMVTMELLKGWPALTFHGTAEWATDYLLTHEAVWLPTEAQLREELQGILHRNGRDTFQLTFANQQYQLNIDFEDKQESWTGKSADQTYAEALLYCLTRDTG